MWEPRTDAKGSGYWPTPDCQNHRDGSKLRKDNNLAEGGRHGVSLHHAVYHWPTPKYHEDRAERYTIETSYKHWKEGRQVALSQVVRDQRMWPTPTVGHAQRGNHDEPVENYLQRVKDYEEGRAKGKPGKSLGVAVRMWPTPRVSDTEGGIVKDVQEKDGTFSRTNAKGVRWGVKLKDAVDHVETPNGGSLNPTWVEWLMGWPIGWTDLKPLETDKFQVWLQQHGESYPKR